MHQCYLVSSAPFALGMKKILKLEGSDFGTLQCLLEKKFKQSSSVVKS